MERAAEQAVISRVVRHALARDPDRLVFVFENGQMAERRVSMSDLAIRGNQLAFGLRMRCLTRGDRVAIMLRNCPEFVYGLVANSKLGLETVPIDPRSRGEKLHHFLTLGECAAMITADYLIADDAVAEIIRSTGVLPYVVSTPEGRARGLDVSTEYPSANELLEGPEREDVGEVVEDVATPWLLGFTSGTTGDPKPLEFNYDRMLLYRRLPGYFGYREDDIPYTGLSLSHANAILVTMMPAVWGVVHHSVFSPWFTKSRLWDVCATHGCTTWSNLGGIATGVYSEPPSPRDRAHSVRLVVSAGMPREIWQPFEQRFGVQILEWYGAMEGGLAYNPVGVGPVGSFGKPPADLLEMDVVDDSGRSVAPGEVGELISRPSGGRASVRYYRNPEASARKVRGGWLHSGDMVWRDEAGWLYFAHRREEGGIRRMGEFISDGFIRRVLAEDPEVLDVHIYGVPAKSGAPGESDIVAALVVSDPEGFQIPAFVRRCANQLERSHVPNYLQLVDELPRTASAKVQTRFLAEQLEVNGVEVESPERLAM
jgi:acyl-CoA synthetase (AMP-forming)/AMP-acid ligase II